MEEVRSTLDQHIESFVSVGDRTEGGVFVELSKRWASHSLETYRDELLTKALAISKALSEFDNELLNGGGV